MKILHVYKDYFPVLGGIENHVRLLAERQAAAGHEVTALVTALSGHPTTVEERRGVRVIKAARFATVASTPLSLALPRLLARERPDITHLHFPYPVGEMSQYFFGRGRPTVISYHSDIVRQANILRYYRPLMERVLTQAERILVATPSYLETSATLQRHRRKCLVIPYGIERRRFIEASREAGAALRARYGGGPLILFVGVLRYYKGLQYLLGAMQQIAARLWIVGEGPRGQHLRDQARALGLGDKAVFVGSVSDEDLPAYYRAAALFVLPASERREAFGLVQVEAMSAGLPVVCTDLGTGTSYVNRHNESGLVVPPRDQQTLADASTALLRDPALRARLAAGALARSELFDADRMVADIEAVYRQILGRET